MKILLQGAIKRNIHWDSKLDMKNVSFVDWHNIEIFGGSLRQDRLKMEWKLMI